ncbi:hypothetical protein CERSUDRAFT_98572 [Gelatoporia subvermispora B]|uniref:Glutaminase A N-terminal domain-containing protein n=1 Tax=Ceriporiopsis subvermispora (strain B) TaxID=914234 RepID=M2QMT9_CERS8|nr:hypothetical protein CERSUDRAFT_98572 [Gelatoporia subvermispora B]
MLLPLCQAVFLSLLGFVLLPSRSAGQPVWPQVVPVAVRSPYFSCWMLTGTQNAGASTQWPQFWGYVNGGDAILGWAGLVKVDNITYQWLGLGFNPANLTDIRLTPTRTIFEMQAGPVNLTITYLMPIEPSDWVQQSLPDSYVSLEAVSTDGLPHDVEAYADISGEWLSGNRSAEIQWATVVGNDIVYHEVSLASPVPFQEINEQANDGVMYHAISQGPNVTWQTGAGAVCRGQFNSTGNLTNGTDMDFRPLDGPGNGAMFAPLALNVHNTTILVSAQFPGIDPSTPTGTHDRNSTSKHVAVGPIIGGVLGGVCTLGLLATAMIVWRCKSRQPEYLVAVPFKHTYVVLQASLHHPQPLFELQPDPKDTIVKKPVPHRDPEEHPLNRSSVAHNPGIDPAVLQLTASSSRSRSNGPRGSRTSEAGPNFPRSYVRELRDEVESLRRIMQELHVDKLAPPPEYESVSHRPR